MNKVNDLISQIDSYVWGLPLIILIMACGILLTVRLRFLQIRKLGKAMKYMVKKQQELFNYWISSGYISDASLILVDGLPGKQTKNAIAFTLSRYHSGYNGITPSKSFDYYQ